MAIAIASQCCCENKMRSYTENAWHNRSTQQTVDAFNFPLTSKTFKALISHNSALWRPSPEAKGPRGPPLGLQKQRTLVCGVWSYSSPLDPGGWKTVPFLLAQGRGPACTGTRPGSATSKMCAVSWPPVSSTAKWQSLSLCPSQGFMWHVRETRCAKQELMQRGFADDQRETHLSIRALTFVSDEG